MREVVERLLPLRDASYRAFHSRLMPDYPAERILGVRQPELRRLAKELAGTPLAARFLAELPHDCYEEYNLHALLLAPIRDFSTVLSETERLLPFVDNWATCDGLDPRAFAIEPARLLPAIDRWLASEHVFTVRFAIVQLMRHHLDAAFTSDVPARVAAVQNDAYYVRMAAAWFFATALAKQYDATIHYLTEARLPLWTHNKTIRKALESYRISPEQKQFLRTLQRKIP